MTSIPSNTTFLVFFSATPNDIDSFSVEVVTDSIPYNITNIYN